MTNSRPNDTDWLRADESLRPEVLAETSVSHTSVQQTSFDVGSTTQFVDIESSDEQRSRGGTLGNASGSAIRVWDLPLRLFHWLLLICVSVALVSAQLGGNWMVWHVRAGALTVGLLLFRGVWGLIGSRYAKFRSFLYSPREVFGYLKLNRSSAVRHAGHSPSGAISVFAMLCILLAQSLSGLFSSDSIATEGELVRFASEEVVSAATSLHVTLQWIVYGLIALHVLAVFAWWLWKKEDLIRPMLSGDKYGVQADPAVDTAAVRVVGLMLMVLVLAMSIWLLT